MERNYYEETQIKNIKKLREILLKLPPFCKDFFRAIEPKTSARTRLSYGYDLIVFFDFLTNNLNSFKNIDKQNIDVSLLDNIKAVDIEEYLEYLSLHKNKNGEYITNSDSARKRKLSSLRSFYKYFYKRELIKTNPTLLVDLPKIKEKPIIRLDKEESINLINEVNTPTLLMSKQETNYHNKNYLRDNAIITLLLGTGLRVSECVGINIDDIEFRENSVVVTRKGGNKMKIYFNEEVAAALKEYLESRMNIEALEGSEKALFLSIQKKRIGVRAVENLVKKYSSRITKTKKITPHKLRSTYGTMLYQESNDIYLVADVLGHKDVNTTRKHYAALDDERRRSAASYVQLKNNKKNNNK